MKTKFIQFLTIFFGFALLLVTYSCGGDDNEDDVLPKDNPSGTSDNSKFSPYGTWQSGKYFISLSNDGLMCAFFDDCFLDCGYATYNESDNKISCSNLYYNKTTIYSIQNLTASSVTLKIDFTDMWGEKKTITKTFSKSTKSVCRNSNPLVGKSYQYSLGGVSTITVEFRSYYTGYGVGDKGSAKQYPLNMFYLWFDNNIYFQTFKVTTQMPSIGGWNPSYEVKIKKVEFNDNGTIKPFAIG